MLTKDELEFGFQVKSLASRWTRSSLFQFCFNIFWSFWKYWLNTFWRFGVNFLTGLSVSPLELTFGRIQQPGELNNQQGWLSFRLPATDTSQSGRTSCLWCWLGWLSTTPTGIIFTQLPLVRSNGRSGMENWSYWEGDRCRNSWNYFYFYKILVQMPVGGKVTHISEFSRDWDFWSLSI